MLRVRLGQGVSVINRRRPGVFWELWSKRGMSHEEGENPASQGSGPTQRGKPLPTGCSADPAIHSTEPLGDDAVAAAEASSASKLPPKVPTNESELPLGQPKSPLSSPKLEHTEVGRSSKPNTHQKRYFTDKSTTQQPATNDINCVGLDVSPWPDDAEGQKAQEADNKEYFKDHKASPLSEIEFVDSRKPVTQATDHAGGGPNVGSYNVGGKEGSVWRPEQLEPAEVTMLRASEIWQWNKMRGDPESPHGRVLRALRGENW